MYWIYFILLSFGVIFAGSRLSVMADALATRFNLSKTWVGLLVLSVITSLPEASTTLGALVRVKAPDLALGNTFGSNIFNLTLIGICDIVLRRRGILRHTHIRNGVAAACTIPVTVLMLLSLLYPLPANVGSLNFGWGSIGVFVVAFALFAYLQKFEAEELKAVTPEAIPVTNTGKAGKSTILLVAKFVMVGILVVVCGILLAETGKRIADIYGLKQSFVGSLLLAMATSLPEAVVGITALRLGSFDMFFGTIMGSNIFNVVLISIADFLYFEAPLAIGLNLGWEHVSTASITLLLTGIVMIVLLSKSSYPSKSKVAPESWLLVGIYLLCMLGLYRGWFALIGA